MSQANVDAVRRYYGEWPDNSERLIATADRFWDSDGDYYPVRKFPEARPCHGRDEIVDFLSEYRAAWKRYQYVVKDARAVGDDRVLVHGHLEAEGRLSGIAIDGDLYHCCWLRHGRLIRVEDHLTANGALHALGLSGDGPEAVGLSEQAMSQENVEIVRRMWDAFLGDDPLSGLSFCDPDIEWDGTNLPDGAIARGHEALVDHAMRWAEQWDDWKIEPERFIDAGDDQVILIFRETGRSESGLQMDERHAELYRLRDGKVIYRKGFSDPDEALEVVGLSEQPPKSA